MAFRDIKVELYDGEVLLEYKDSSHRYSVSEKMPDGSWSKPHRPISVTGMKDDTLEKKGLQNWSMGLALRHLFGFYDFKNEQGNEMIGFSEAVGILWGSNGKLISHTREECLESVKTASRMWREHQRKGADIGSMVHDAVEQYINGTPFEITIDRYRETFHSKGGVFESEAEQAEWEKKAPGEVAMANVAFGEFKQFWDKLGAKVVDAEQIVYSREMDLAGTYDYDLQIPGRGNVLADLKTSKASLSAGAPEGVYYDFFIQLGIYAAIKVEMGHDKPADLVIFSARKEGGFTAVYASEVGLTVDQCMAWGKCVAQCYRFMKATKKALIKRANVSEAVIE